MAGTLPQVTSITISGLSFFGHHGVSQEEREEGRDYFVSITLAIEPSHAEHTDSIADTVDYGDVAALVHETGTAIQYYTVERLARVMCEALLNNFAAIQSIELHLEKVDPPTPVPVHAAGVIIRMSRHES